MATFRARNRGGGAAIWPGAHGSGGVAINKTPAPVSVARFGPYTSGDPDSLNYNGTPHFLRKSLSDGDAWERIVRHGWAYRQWRMHIVGDLLFKFGDEVFSFDQAVTFDDPSDAVAIPPNRTTDPGGAYAFNITGVVTMIQALGTIKDWHGDDREDCYVSVQGTFTMARFVAHLGNHLYATPTQLDLQLILYQRNEDSTYTQCPVNDEVGEFLGPDGISLQSNWRTFPGTTLASEENAGNLIIRDESADSYGTCALRAPDNGDKYAFGCPDLAVTVEPTVLHGARPAI